jgi:hypothetical protein
MCHWIGEGDGARWRGREILDAEVRAQEGEAEMVKVGDGEDRRWRSNLLAYLSFPLEIELLGIFDKEEKDETVEAEADQGEV